VPVPEAAGTVGTRCLPPPSGRAMRAESDVTQAARPRGSLSGQGTVVSRQVRDGVLTSGRTVPSCITPCFDGAEMRVGQTTPAGRQGSAVSGQGDIATVTRRTAPSHVNVSPDDRVASTSMRVDGDAVEAALPLAASRKPEPKVACRTAGTTMRGEDESGKCVRSTVERTADSAVQPRDDLPRDLPVVLGQANGRHCAPEERRGDVIAQESDLWVKVVYPLTLMQPPSHLARPALAQCKMAHGAMQEV
jgi:hypothetical protein